MVGPIALPLLGTEFEVITPTRSLTKDLTASASGKLIIDAPNSLVAVVSHDCEFNEGKRNKLLVARLQNLPGNLTEERTEAIWASNDVEARVATGEPVAVVDNFALDPLTGVFDRPQVVSFTTITPLPMAMASDLLAAKRGELTHDVRVRLRKKLAWFLGRDADDIPDAEKSDAPAPAENEQA